MLREYFIYNFNLVRISLYSIFIVFPPSSFFNNTFNLFPDVHIEKPTYNCHEKKLKYF